MNERRVNGEMNISNISIKYKLYVYTQSVIGLFLFDKY